MSDDDDSRTIGPTPERLAKAGGDFETSSPDESIHHRAIRMLDGHVLEYLQSRSIITGDQYAAGVQFCSDWYYAGLANSGVIDPGRVIVDGGQSDHLSDVRMAALTRFQKAIQAVGKIQGDVLTDILLVEERLEDWGRRHERQTNRTRARLVAITALKLSLASLDQHYDQHYDRHRGARRATAATRSSHMADYRPIIHMPDETS